MTQIPEGINPRYYFYCVAHGKTVDEMEVYIERRWNGSMHDYIIWIGTQISDWSKERNPKGKQSGLFSKADHIQFDAWLSKKYEVSQLVTNSVI